MDRVTARTFVASKIEDPDQNRWTASQYNLALDAGNSQFCIDARAIVRNNTATVLVSGTSKYSLPSDFLVSLLFRHDGLKLAPSTRYELSFQSGTDWTVLPNGTPVAFYIDEENEQFGLVPAPDANAATKTLTIDYIGIPAAMTQDTGGGTAGNLLNNKAILQAYAMGVVAWAAAEMLTYIPQTAEIAAKRAVLLKDYERYLSEAITTYRNMTDEPLRLTGGQVWQDAHVVAKDNAFSG